MDPLIQVFAWALLPVAWALGNRWRGHDYFDAPKALKLAALGALDGLALYLIAGDPLAFAVGVLTAVGLTPGHGAYWKPSAKGPDMEEELNVKLFGWLRGMIGRGAYEAFQLGITGVFARAGVVLYLAVQLELLAAAVVLLSAFYKIPAYYFPSRKQNDHIMPAELLTGAFYGGGLALACMVAAA
jgi:hypothetical protein